MKIAGNVGYSTKGNVYAFAPTSITESATINLSPTSVLSYLGNPVAPDLSLHQVFFGTVIGVALVTLGHDSTEVVEHLDRVAASIVKVRPWLRVKKSVSILATWASVGSYTVTRYPVVYTLYGWIVSQCSTMSIGFASAV